MTFLGLRFWRLNYHFVNLSEPEHFHDVFVVSFGWLMCELLRTEKLKPQLQATVLFWSNMMQFIDHVFGLKSHMSECNFIVLQNIKPLSQKKNMKWSSVQMFMQHLRADDSLYNALTYFLWVQIAYFLDLHALYTDWMGSRCFCLWIPAVSDLIGRGTEQKAPHIVQILQFITTLEHLYLSITLSWFLHKLKS